MTLSSIALIGVPAATADEQQTTAEQNTAAKPSVIINEVYAGNTKAPDMKVSSIKSDNLIVTILATSNCDDKNASTKFNDSATRLTLQDSDDNVVADAVFDFSGLFHVYRAVVQQAQGHGS